MRALFVTAVITGALSAPLAAQQGTLVVLSKSTARAAIIDVATGETMVTLPTGEAPHEVVLSSDGRVAVGTDYGPRANGNTLTVIDVPARRVARTIDLGRHRGPHGIAFLPDDRSVVVTTEGSRDVLVVDATEGAVTAEIPTNQGGSHMLALVGDGSRLFTSNGQDNSVSELSVDDGEFVRSMGVAPRPEAITVTVDGSEVWVGSNEGGTVGVLDPATGGFVEVFEGFGWPYRILIAPDNRLMLIPDLRGNALRFFDRESRTELSRLEFPGAGPQGVTMTPDQRFAFLSLSAEGRVAVIDLSTRAVVGHIATPPRPDGIAYTTRVFR